MWILGLGEYPDFSPILKVSIEIEDNVILLWPSMLVVFIVEEKVILVRIRRMVTNIFLVGRLVDCRKISNCSTLRIIQTQTGCRLNQGVWNVLDYVWSNWTEHREC